MAFESCGALKASPTPGSESDASGLVHPRGDVALFVKHAPDVNVLGAFDVKDQIGIAPQRPKPQISKPELMRMARLTRRHWGSGVLRELVMHPSYRPCFVVSPMQSQRDQLSLQDRAELITEMAERAELANLYDRSQAGHH